MSNIFFAYRKLVLLKIECNNNKLYIYIDYIWGKTHCNLTIQLEIGELNEFDFEKKLLYVTKIDSETIYNNLSLFVFENCFNDQLFMVKNYLDNCNLIQNIE